MDCCRERKKRETESVWRKTEKRKGIEKKECEAAGMRTNGR